MEHLLGLVDSVYRTVTVRTCHPNIKDWIYIIYYSIQATHKGFDTRKYSQVLARTRKCPQVLHASHSQILASPDLGANIRK